MFVRSFDHSEITCLKPYKFPIFEKKTTSFLYPLLYKFVFENPSNNSQTPE